LLAASHAKDGSFRGRRLWPYLDLQLTLEIVCGNDEEEKRMKQNLIDE
jgi:hypothetical protein